MRRKGILVLAALVVCAVLGAGALTLRSGGNPYKAGVLADHPVAFWTLSPSSSREADASGHGHGGRYIGGVPARARLPDGASAAGFNGSSQYLRVPSSAVLSVATHGQLTWEAWIRPQTLQFRATDTGYVDWMGKCALPAACEWQARMYTSVNHEGRCNRLSAYAFNPAAQFGSGAYWQAFCGVLQAQQWLYVVGEYQTQHTPARCDPRYPGTINIWVNGVPWNSSDHPRTGCMSQYQVVPHATGAPLTIGAVLSGGFFDGAIGDAAVYDHLLSQAQISRHYRLMTHRSPSGYCASSCTP